MSIAYICDGCQCDGPIMCGLECTHTLNRQHSKNYKDHEPTREELEKNFVNLAGDINVTYIRGMKRIITVEQKMWEKG